MNVRGKGRTESQRDRSVQRTELSDGEGLPLFILSVTAGGAGPNLTVGSAVFDFDRWWDPAVENKANQPCLPHRPA
jgi:SNF2 family DNA or RNA helicase